MTNRTKGGLAWALVVAGSVLACGARTRAPASPPRQAQYGQPLPPPGTPPAQPYHAAPAQQPQQVGALPWLVPGAPPPWWPAAPPPSQPSSQQPWVWPFPPVFPGAGGCPHPGDVMCAKGCTNPQTDNFACGCAAGGTGAVCAATQECCGGQCLSCPAGQTIDPSSCGCVASAQAQQPTLYLLTNASNGTFFGTEAQLQGRTRCSFEGGGVGCQASDVVTYQKLLEPSASEQQTRDAACQGFTNRYHHPLGIGWKALWKPTNQRYGLWDETVSFLHGCVKDGPP